MHWKIADVLINSKASEDKESDGCKRIKYFAYRNCCRKYEVGHVQQNLPH
ncbi:MAG: hypothetical protein ABFD50_21345 [Smithella sp.]